MLVGAGGGGVLPDGVLPDGVLPDGVLPDGVSPDGVSPDGASPGATLLDVGIPAAWLNNVTAPWPEVVLAIFEVKLSNTVSPRVMACKSICLAVVEVTPCCALELLDVPLPELGFA